MILMNKLLMMDGCVILFVFDGLVRKVFFFLDFNFYYIN